MHSKHMVISRVIETIKRSREEHWDHCMIEGTKMIYRREMSPKDTHRVILSLMEGPYPTLSTKYM